MSELKATPGPWFVTDSHYPSIKEISGPSFGIKAVMWATDLTEDDYQKRSADLNLIAAAPELYEALETCLLYGAMTGDDWVSLKAENALAKARGEV